MSNEADRLIAQGRVDFSGKLVQKFKQAGVHHADQEFWVESIRRQGDEALLNSNRSLFENLYDQVEGWWAAAWGVHSPGPVGLAALMNVPRTSTKLLVQTPTGLILLQTTIQGLLGYLSDPEVLYSWYMEQGSALRRVSRELVARGFASSFLAKNATQKYSEFELTKAVQSDWVVWKQGKFVRLLHHQTDGGSVIFPHPVKGRVVVGPVGPGGYFSFGPHDEEWVFSETIPDITLRQCVVYGAVKTRELVAMVPS